METVNLSWFFIGIAVVCIAIYYRQRNRDFQRRADLAQSRNLAKATAIREQDEKLLTDLSAHVGTAQLEERMRHHAQLGINKEKLLNIAELAYTNHEKYGPLAGKRKRQTLKATLGW